MSFSSFYSVVNAIKDKSAEAMTTLSSDLQDFKSIVQEDVAELSKSVRQNIHEGRLSVDRKEPDEDTTSALNLHDDKESKQDQDQNQEHPTVESTPASTEENGADEDPLTLLKNSIFSFDVTNSLQSVSSSVQGSFTSVQGSLTSVSSKLQSLNVTSSLGSLEAMGSKLLNSADEFLGALAGDTVYEDEEEVSESELSARRFRLLALQEDLETYTEPPLDVETFEKWKLAINGEDLTEIEKDVLENYPAVGVKLSELVPSVVDADVFWRHYIYKASLLAAQEQRGADLLQHALNDEEEIGWDVDSPKAKDGEGQPIFSDDELKEDDGNVPACPAATNGPASSSDGESWIELDERKESTSPIAPAILKEPPTCALIDLKLEEVDEAEEKDSLDWGDDDDLSLPETNTDVISEAKVPEATTSAAHEDGSKRGEDWGEWD